MRYFLDMVISFSMLQFHWLILVSCFVIIVEALVLYVFWKELRLAVLISVVMNMASALIALPFLFIGTPGGSLWFGVINGTELLITEGQLNLIFFLLIFGLALGLTILVELLVGKAFKVPTEKRIVVFIITNIITYSIIVSTLIGLGAWFGLTNQDLTRDSWDFFEGKLFQTVPVDSTTVSLQLSMFFFGLLIVSLLLVWIYLRTYKKNISRD